MLKFLIHSSPSPSSSTSVKSHLFSRPFLDQKSTPPSPGSVLHENSDPDQLSVFDAWNASRPCSQPSTTDNAKYEKLQPGSHRKCTMANLFLAYKILQATFLDMLHILWGLNPLRTTFLIGLTILRGLLPAFRGYSQALILDEAGQFLL